jgi:hypothetical protein
VVVNPFPDLATLLELDCVRGLYEDDITIEEVDKRFKERITQLELKLRGWRTGIEVELSKHFDLEHNSGSKATLKVGNRHLRGSLESHGL